MNFMFSWQEQYLTRSLRSLVRYCCCHSNIKFISSRHRVISSIYVVRVLCIPPPNLNRPGEVNILGQGLYSSYSGTPLIRPPSSHGKLVVLTGWSYLRGFLKGKITDGAFFGPE